MIESEPKLPSMPPKDHFEFYEFFLIKSLAYILKLFTDVFFSICGMNVFLKIKKLSKNRQS